MDGRNPTDPTTDRPRFAWGLLLRGVGAANDPRCLLLAALGLVALKGGWAGIAAIFGDASWQAVTNPTRFPFLDLPGQGPSRGTSGLPVVAPFPGVIAPFVAMFSPTGTALDRLGALAGSLWTLAVWSLFGGAITRIAAVRVAKGGRTGLLPALKFSLRRFGSTMAAPLAPLAVAWLIGLAGAAVGTLNRLPFQAGTAAATLLAFVPLIVGLLNAVILLGLAAAWPLMVATVVVEGEDFFDAVSRSYSYVNQRILRYAGSVAVIGAMGFVGLTFFSLFVAVTLSLADWSLGLGAPAEVGFRFLRPETVDGSGLSDVGRFWNAAVEFFVAGWAYSYFWSAAALIYLALRRDVDGNEIHDIHEPGHEADSFVPEEDVPAQSKPMPETSAPNAGGP